MALPRVLLVDDYPDFRSACAQLLADEFLIVGELDNALGLAEAVAKLAPDVILLDISMPGVNGLDAAEQLLQHRPATKIIFLTALSNQPYVTKAFQIGARGYVLKHSATELRVAVRQVLQGKRYLSASLGQIAENILARSAGREVPRR